jgi:Domain of unknown function (DUF4157)
MTTEPRGARPLKGAIVGIDPKADASAPGQIHDLQPPAGKPSPREGGKPLASGVRRAMEARLGHSFADVRVHSDPGAARALGARAFSVRRDIVFGEGEFSLSTGRGRALLAHELAHVVQQRAPGDVDPAHADAEASEAGRAVATGRSFAPRMRTGPQVALQEEGESDVAEAQPADEEAALRAERPTELSMFKEEQLSFARERISAARLAISRGMADLAKHPEAGRPPLRAQIFGFERELADALIDTADLLTHRISELEARAAAGENVKAEVNDTRRELADARADIATLQGVFSPEKGAAFEDTYKNKVAGLHCMGAAYAGLGALTSPEQSAAVERQVAEQAKKGLKRKHPVDLDQFITIMDTASADKIAGPKQRAAWRKRRKSWMPTLESIVRARVNTSVPGFYFFGLALAEAYHSVLIGVSTWEKPARMLWCDQHGCQQIKGTLDAFARGEAEGYQIGYGDWDTYLWQVLPPAAASLFPLKEDTP